jgi:predicted lipase
MDLWRFALNAPKEFHTMEQFVTGSGYNPSIDGEIINFQYLSNDIDYGYGVEFEDRTIFVFRGTRKTFESWIKNFDVYPLREDLLKKGPWGDGTIHDGFYSGWSAFKDMVNNMAGSKPIFCTGHSRGGALCTLCARHIAKNLKKTCSNIAFAAPMQGTNNYRDEFNLLPIDSTLIVNGYDIVPTLPPQKLGFRSVGKTIQLKQPFWHKWLCRTKDHYPSEYDKALTKFFNQK